jgi:rubredoxin
MTAIRRYIMWKTCPDCGSGKEVPITEKRTAMRCDGCGAVFDGVRRWSV